GNCAGLGVKVSHCADEVSCRLFLCGRCRSQVLVCRDCDRGQIYCFGTCAQDARRENQREARRRYQATPRGRAMHAARSRRYRARGQCVTDHSPANEQKAGPLLELEVGEALSEPSRSRKSPLQWLCHHCRRSASEFVRLHHFVLDVTVERTAKSAARKIMRSDNFKSYRLVLPRTSHP